MRASEDDIKEMEERHIMNEFSRRKKIRYAVVIIGVLLIAVILVSSMNSAAFASMSAYIVLGIAVVVLALSILLWRCPSCKKYLGRGTGLKSCQNCGVKLQE